VYNAFYVPVAIAFDYELEGNSVIPDVAAVIIYVLDIYIKSRTSIHDSSDQICKNIGSIMFLYAKDGLIFDILAAIPTDYICLLLGAPHWILAIFRLVRLLKVYRIMRLVW
jgi:hypothetical protein